MSTHRATSRSRFAMVVGLAWVAGCGGAEACLLYPCPQFEAVTVAVAAGTGAASLPGLSVTVTGTELGTLPCDPLGKVCHVYGGAGSYQLTVSATGYAPATVSADVTGLGAGCNACGRVDRVQVAVTLQPQT